MAERDGSMAGPVLTCLVFVSVVGTVKADFVFGEPRNLGPTVNGPSGDAPYFFSSDGLKMYSDSQRSGGYGIH